MRWKIIIRYTEKQIEELDKFYSGFRRLFSVLELRHEKRLEFSLICARSLVDKVKEKSADWPD